MRKLVAGGFVLTDEERWTAYVSAEIEGAEYWCYSPSASLNRVELLQVAFDDVTDRGVR